VFSFFNLYFLLAYYSNKILHIKMGEEDFFDETFVAAAGTILKNNAQLG
jgi:hypothetical protein